MTESDDQLIMKATIDTDNAFPYPLLPTMTLSVRDGLLVHMPFIYDVTSRRAPS